MDIFVLTETPLISKFRKGLLKEDCHVDVRDFILTVHEVTKSSANEREYVLEALVIADIEFRHLKSVHDLNKANHVLAGMVEQAHNYVLHKIDEHKNNLGTFVPAKEEEIIDMVDLTWIRSKSELAALSYALRVGQCFSPKDSQKDIVEALAKAFNVDMTMEYAKKRIYESKMSVREHKTGIAFLERLLAAIKYVLGVEKSFDAGLYAIDVESDDDCA